MSTETRSFDHAWELEKALGDVLTINEDQSDSSNYRDATSTTQKEDINVFGIFKIPKDQTTQRRLTGRQR